MARITAGVTTSHVRAIAAAIDLNKTAEPYWAPVFKGFEFSKRWMAEHKPDVAILIYNDHASGSMRPSSRPSPSVAPMNSNRPTKAGAAALCRWSKGTRIWPVTSRRS
jgi:Catalytic LigB subunit of aromatic ring-opening dioxygenase